MQLYCGIYNRQVRAVTNDFLQEMTDRHFLLKESSKQILIADSAGFVTAVTGQQVYNSDTTVFKNEKTGLFLVGEIRLFNKEQLKELLNIIPETGHYENHQYVLEAYIKWGEECPRYLNGDFSFVIWDSGKKKLFCVRDHLGQRPFFYYLDNDAIVFSTNIQPIFAHPSVNKEINKDWAFRFIAKLPVSKDTTAYKNIKRLPPGCTLSVTTKECLVKQYWNLENTSATPVNNINEAIAGLRAHLIRSVESRIDANYPMGVELSGGLDSGGIAAIAQHLMKQKGRTINAYTDVLPQSDKTTFKNFYDEWDKARLVAKNSEIENHFAIDGTSETPLEQIELELNTLGYPGKFEFSLTQKGVYDKSVLQKDRILLSGAGGDELVTEGATNRYPYTILKEKGLSKLVEHYKKRNKFFFKAYYRAFRFYMHYITQKDLMLGPGKKRWLYLPIKKSLISKKKFIRSGFFPPNQTIKERCLWRLNRTQLNERLETGYNLTNAMGITYSYPLLDVQLMEYYYGLPDEWKGNQQISRYLYREAVKDFLPTEILMQSKGSNYAAIPFGRVEKYKNMDLLCKECLSISKSNKVFEFVDYNKLIDLIHFKSENKDDVFKYKQLYSIVTLSRFFDRIEANEN